MTLGRSGCPADDAAGALPAATHGNGAWSGLAAALSARIARMSLTCRLTAYCSVFAGALVAASMGTAYWELSSALAKRAHGELRGEWKVASEAVSRLRYASLVASDTAARSALRGEHPGLSIAVLRADGQPLAMFGKEGDELSAVAERLSERDVVEFDWDDCLLAALAGKTISADGTQVLLLIGIDRTEDRELLAARRRSLIAACLVSALIIGGLARTIARRSLQPLRRFATQVDRLSASHLGRRLDECDVPRELREFAAAFNNLLENLDQAFERLRGFSSDIAHELRSPLAALATQTQFALSHSRTTHAYRETLESNAEELQRMTRMVSEMVFLAQVDNPAAALQRKPIVLHVLCSKVIEFYQLAADERNIRICLAGNSVARAEAGLVERALANLLSNAIRHTADGGTIAVRIAARAEGGACIEVENPGPGIPAALQDRIFHRFVRGGPAAHDSDASRAGLGLAIVRSIMALHGGSAHVTSPARGPTTFSLHFPD